MPFYACSRVFPLAELHQTRVLSQLGGSSFFFFPQTTRSHIHSREQPCSSFTLGSRIQRLRLNNGRPAISRGGITAVATTGACRDERRLTFLRRSGSFLMRNCNVSIIREDVQGQGELSWAGVGAKLGRERNKGARHVVVRWHWPPTPATASQRPHLVRRDSRSSSCTQVTSSSRGTTEYGNFPRWFSSLRPIRKLSSHPPSSASLWQPQRSSLALALVGGSMAVSISRLFKRGLWFRGWWLQLGVSCFGWWFWRIGGCDKGC